MPDLLLTKLAPSEPGSGRDEMASTVLHRAVQRLQIVCIVVIVAQPTIWLATIVIMGTLRQEFQSAAQAGPPLVVLAATVLMLALARSGRFAPVTVIRSGLAYEVVVSFGIAASSYLDAFAGMSLAEFNVDRVGLSYVALWMIVFSVLVPARPREAFVALLASGSAVPLVYLLQIPGGSAPALPPETFFLIFALPYVVVIAGALVIARIVHRLGVEVRRAYAMGSYRLEARLGLGGMGEVWRASHHTLARPAAIKLIRRDALGSDLERADLAAARFEREAQAIASLQSSHTIQLYDYGTTADGTLYYVMELLDGLDLERLVRRDGPMPAARVVHVLQQACLSLGEAHRRGIMHRDVKPANLYLCRYALQHDVLKILDFGLAKPLSLIGEATGGPQTRADVVVGTPTYLAPELALGQAADGRADLYSLGCVAFWLLTGRLVFEAETAAAAIVAHVHDDPPRPAALAELEVPGELDRLVLECLAKDPAARPPTAEALAERLRQIPLTTAWTQDAARRWWSTRGSALGEAPLG